MTWILYFDFGTVVTGWSPSQVSHLDETHTVCVCVCTILRPTVSHKVVFFGHSMPDSLVKALRGVGSTVCNFVATGVELDLIGRFRMDGLVLGNVLWCL